MHRRIALSASLFTLVLAAHARGDTVTGTKSYEAVAESKHEIEIELDRGHATLRVRRTFRNVGQKHDQAMVHVTDMPFDAVATGLRTLAMKDGKPIWYAGELMEAEAAAKKYKELTGIGGYYPKDPALLSWRTQGHLALQVFPIDPGGTKTVEYTLEMPTKYVDGRDVLVLPAMGVPGRPPLVTVSAHVAADQIEIGAGKVAAGTVFPLSKGTDLSIVRASPPKLGGSYAGFSFGKGRALMHTSFELAPKLSEVPKGAWVVVLLDASRSLTDAQRKAEINAARAYVEHFVDGHVAVVSFARTPKARTNGFVATKDALAELGKLAIVGENGSAIDAAFAEANRLLATAPSKVAKRIVAITDFRTRNAFTPQMLTAATTASGATVHLSFIEAGNAHLERDDDDRWAAAARATGGVLWRASSPIAATATTTHVYEEWARPVRVDRLAMTGVGLPGDGLGLPYSMREGEGFEDLRLSSFATPTLAITGELWSTKTSLALSPTDEQNRLWSALVFGSDLLQSLTEPEMMTLAMKGRAVSPVTSYLAIEPGVRPSTEGLDWSEGFGVGGLGLSGVGGGGAGAGIGVGATVPDRIGWLRKALAPAMAKCGAAGRTATVRLETTISEVVSASVTALSGAKDGAIDRCLEESGWALALPTSFDQEWAVFDVKL